jgi:hypothetical protein
VFHLQVITNEMKEFLCQLRNKVDVGMVGGSEYCKAQEQLGGGDGKPLSLNEFIEDMVLMSNSQSSTN